MSEVHAFCPDCGWDVSVTGEYISDQPMRRPEIQAFWNGVHDHNNTCRSWVCVEGQPAAMSGRRTYVYRLEIEYPAGIDWRNPPENWEPIFIPPDDSTSFQWPRERRFLSKRAAEHRAERLRSYGCTVEVRRSQPVVW